MEEAIKSVTPASFICEKCNGTPSMDQIFKSVATYGLIWLNNDENAWIGFNCPLCEKPSTNIKKFKHEEIRPFRLQLEYRITYILGTLIYHSFPFSVHHPVKGRDFAGQYIEQLKLPVDQLNEETFDYSQIEEYPGDSKKLYTSYSFGYKAFGPAIAIWWYKDEDIENLASYESESGLRAFPRYRLYECIYPAIDRFCWKERLYIDFINKTKFLYPNTITDILLANSTKKDLTKTFEFMHFLGMSHRQETREFMTGENQLVGSLIGLSEVPEETADHHHEKISSVVWDNFTKDYVQDLLKMLSEKFIDEYIALSDRTDFSFGAVWELKEKYLSDLKNAIESRHERKKLEQGAREHFRSLAQDAEKCFPGVEIISQNFAIDKLKINISRLPKVFKKPEAFLILGERGTGKGLFAEAIHEAYGKIGRKGNNVLFDCGVRNENLFKSELFGHVKGAFTGADRNHKGALEEAKDGTIFIDEIGNLPMSLQAAMLGFLQDWKFRSVGSTVTKDISAMVVLATNKDLEVEIENGNFRADLYDRIRHIDFKIPPLRSRKEDIKILIKHFIKMHDEQRHEDPSLEEFTVTSDCIKALTDYDWPGNVRDLGGVLKKIVKFKSGADDRSPINENDLPNWLFSDSNSKDQVHPKSDTPSHPDKYGRLPEDDAILIQHKQDGMKGREVGKLYGVRREAVYRRYSKIEEKAKNNNLK